MNVDTFLMYYGGIGVVLCLLIFCWHGYEHALDKTCEKLGAESAFAVVFLWPLLLAMLIGYIIGGSFKDS